MGGMGNIMNMMKEMGKMDGIGGKFFFINLIFA